MAHKPRLVFISSIATPQQVKFCRALQDHFDTAFWFYEYPDRARGSFWRIDLGQDCRVLAPVYFLGPKRSGRYFAPRLIDDLDRLEPDIVMLGGFSIPSNYLAYRWAVKRGKRVMVFTERSRNRRGVLRKRSLVWGILRRLYRKLDMVMVSAEDAVEQFRDDFGFGGKVVAGRYSADLDDYFDHPLRVAKPAYSFLFANRLVPIYDPIKAIDIFAAIAARHPGSKLTMNASGELRQACEEHSRRLGLSASVEFLDGLKNWSDLGLVYARSDMLLLPAAFSNGNFTILEAMASGMGIVMSDRILGMGDLIRDGESGFVCEPTFEAFVDRIERYIAEPDLLRRHAEINRPRVAPLSARGTARFFAGILEGRFAGAPAGRSVD